MDNKRILVKNLKTGHYEYISESEYNKSNGWKYVFLTIFYVAAFGFFVFFFYSLYLDKYKIYLDVNEVYIEQGENYQVELSPKYSDYFNYSNYVYDIEDKSIAEVNDYGEVINPEEVSTYIQMADAWIDDIDGKSNKIWWYFVK